MTDHVETLQGGISLDRELHQKFRREEMEVVLRKATKTLKISAARMICRPLSIFHKIGSETPSGCADTGQELRRRYPVRKASLLRLEQGNACAPAQSKKDGEPQTPKWSHPLCAHTKSPSEFITQKKKKISWMSSKHTKF